MPKSTQNIAVVVPNWNGKDSLKACLDSLLIQTQNHTTIVVENGSTDGSLEFLQENYPDVQLVINKTNRGFAGGVNDGIQLAVKHGVEFVALFNNDAVAEKNWLKELSDVMAAEKEFGIATGKLLSADGAHMDSTGENYTVWGLPFPRGRDESVSNSYDEHTSIFAASGGASLYRVKMLEEIGLFDEDFFAYYEDVDISFRAQLSAWQVRYVPEAIAYHQIGATSGKIRGFTTYQTMKNLPLVWFKNVPRRYLFKVGIRFWLAYALFFWRAVLRGHGWSALKGVVRSKLLLIKKIRVRISIQKNRKVSNDYIWAMMTHDLPPSAYNLRRIRKLYRTLRRKKL
ncbi:glycosyltransferase family 2 protein [soil metagenome]